MAKRAKNAPKRSNGAAIFKAREELLKKKWPKKNSKQRRERALYALKYIDWVLTGPGWNWRVGAEKSEPSYKQVSPGAAQQSVGSLVTELETILARILGRMEVNGKPGKLVQEITSQERKDLMIISGLLSFEIKEYDAYRNKHRRSTMQGVPLA